MSDDTFASLFERARAWFERAQAAGWLTERDLERLARVEQATPADLFARPQMRPLVVAFFGGTGVGKSSLLNRLAGEPIATTGLERPTSREVTFFVHQDVELAKLPPQLPVDSVRVRRHTSDRHRDVAWIDAPDIDSTEERNRRCALACLPHIDLLTYVVSPERYKDDAGWRVLVERGHKHGWLFVMNRWDEGDPRQRADFAQMLRGADFENPIVLCTCCAGHRQLPLPGDEFPSLAAHIRAVLDAHGVRELTRLGHRARLLDLRTTLIPAAAHVGDEETWTRVRSDFQRSWQAARAAVIEGTEWTIRMLASRLATRESGFLAQAHAAVDALGGRRRQGPSPSSAGNGADPGASPPADDLTNLLLPLWDEWCQTRVEGALDALEVTLARAHIRGDPVMRRRQAVTESAARNVLREAEAALRIALANPGSRVTRAARRLAGFLTMALPAAALAWVAYELVRGYYRASVGQGPFFGSDFAVHSILLVIVAWALPFTGDRLLRPSVETTALGALRAGFAIGLDREGEAMIAALDSALVEARAFSAECATIIADISRLVRPDAEPRAPAVTRLVVRTPETVAPS